MKSDRLRFVDAMKELPPAWPDDLFPSVQAAVRQSGVKVVVLDDDPTGTQTVFGVPVLTEWPVAALQAELANDLPAFYLLTNTRSLLLPEARALNEEIGRNLVQAAKATGRNFVVVSRSDSTLRGHFPGELDALVATLAEPFDAWIIAPFFLEGGRYTFNDVHYVADGEWLVPAGDTPYARDATFGFKSSNLRQWVAEKTAGRVATDSVASISIEDIRLGGPEQVRERLLALPTGSICVVNAVSMQDLAVFVRGLLMAEANGRRYLYRTAASFVSVRASIPSRPLLTPEELNLPASGGGMFVVGSYVPKSTTQVSALLDQPDVNGVEINVQALLSDAERAVEIERAAAAANALLAKNEDVVLFTSRHLITGPDAEKSLKIGQSISEGLIAIVRAITVRPRYLLAKGGITSSDVATKGLGIKRAMVMGQILPGVPVWQTGPESRHPGLAYIVFPGNVGRTDALVMIRSSLQTRG
ncbi:MAG: hypothetical protein KC421_26500 [Anaerolineales bacterium]|nr:hypothetical protein [Anaerolineales bacterium]